MKKTDTHPHQQNRGQPGVSHAAVPSHEPPKQAGLMQLQRLIGNSAVNRLFRSFRGTPAGSPTPSTRISRKPKGVNMALQGRGRVSQMADDDITLKLSGSVGNKGKNNPDDVRLVQAKLRKLDYLSAEHFADETPEADAKDAIPAKKLSQTILAIRAFQRHAQLTSNTDGRIDPGGTTNKLLDVEDKGVENTAARAADEITSMFESGGDYGETFLGDSGVVSYGKHQATLTSGTLYKLLNLFVTNYRSKSDYAVKLDPYLTRVKRQDESLEGDSTFIKLLEDAGHSDPHMQAAQDEFFDQHYGGAARKQMANAGVTSALAYAFFYDTQIHGGLAYDLKDTIEVLGGKVGEKGKGGKVITEEAFMKEITKQRQDRNRGFGEAQLKKAETLTKKADELAKAGKPEEAAGLRHKAAQLTKNGNALVRSSSDEKGRLGMWRNWANNEDLDLSGDDNGMLMVKGVPVVGLRDGATLRSNGAPTAAPAGSGTPAQTPSPAPAPQQPAPSSNGAADQTPQTAAPTQKKDDDSGIFGSIFDQLESSLDFLSKARRINTKYAAKPPMPGWPYRKELQAIWNSGSYDDFAMKVLKLQIHLLGLSPDDKEADGILGEKTARAILKVSRPEFLVDELVEDNTEEIEMDPVDARSPGANTPASDAPAADNKTPAPTADTESDVEPDAPQTKAGTRMMAGNHIHKSTFLPPKFDPKAVNDFDTAMTVYNAAHQALAEPGTKEEDAERKKTFEEARDKLYELANGVFEGFPDALKGKNPFGIPTGALERTQFLDHLSQIFGSTANVVQFFQRVRKADVPGEVYLHDDAATAIEHVAQELKGHGQKMPSTTVALGIRSRYKPHTRNSKSYMSHMLGFAIDYHATTNLHLDNSGQRALANLHSAESTGGPAYLKMGDYNQRRDFLMDMEAGQVDQAQMDTFFAKFESEYNRVAKASKEFGESLGADGVDKLRDLQKRYFELRYKREDLAKEAKKKDANQEEIKQKGEALNEQEKALHAEGQQILKPWYEMIDRRRKKLEKDLKDNPDKKKVDSITLELKILDDLEGMLQGDLESLLGVPRDPTAREKKAGIRPMSMAKKVSHKTGLSFFQLMDDGYFSPNDKGFDMEFMKTMMLHGFELGAFWGSSDAMHFEHVRSVDATPDPKQKHIEEGLKKYDARYSTPRKRKKAAAK